MVAVAGLHAGTYSSYKICDTSQSLAADTPVPYLTLKFEVDAQIELRVKPLSFFTASTK